MGNYYMDWTTPSRIIGACLVLLLLVPVADGQGYDGAKFLRACNAEVKQRDGLNISEEESIEALWCVSYVSGFLDALAVSELMAPVRKAICLPQRGITTDQAARILVKYLRDNPEKLHQSGRISLFVALAKVFPCR